MRKRQIEVYTTNSSVTFSSVKIAMTVTKIPHMTFYRRLADNNWVDSAFGKIKVRYKNEAD